MVFNLGLILIIIILNILLNNPNKKTNLMFLRIVFIIFFVLTASREMTIGNDTPMYIRIYKECVTYGWEIVKFGKYIEVGYLALNVIISYISKSPRFFIIIMSAIFNYCSYRFIRDNSKNYFLSCIMYVGLLFLYTSMTMMRQFTALSIILFSTKYAKDKKLIPFTLTVLIATLFHSSAYIAFLYYPIYNLKYNKKNVLIIITLGIIGSLNIGFLFDYIANLIGRVNYYSNRVGSDSISNVIYTIMYFIMYLFAIYEIKKNKKETAWNDNNNFYLYSLLFAAIINMLGINMNIMSRAALYFDILAITSFPNVIACNITNITNRKSIKILFIIFFTLYSSIIIYYKPEWNTAFNYKSCILPKEGYICESR